MRIRLDQIDDEPFTWEETVSLSPAELGRSELVALGEVHLSGEIRRTDPGFHLKGLLTYEQTLLCDRCLDSAAEAVSNEIELWVQSGEPADLAPEEELEESDLGVLHVADEVLDTEPLIREQVQLGIPMKPLCRPDCKGLCPTCGADLNLGPCRCSGEETDPRWAGLAALRGRFD